MALLLSMLLAGSLAAAGNPQAVVQGDPVRLVRGAQHAYVRLAIVGRPMRGTEHIAERTEPEPLVPAHSQNVTEDIANQAAADLERTGLPPSAISITLRNTTVSVIGDALIEMPLTPFAAATFDRIRALADRPGLNYRIQYAGVVIRRDDCVNLQRAVISSATPQLESTASTLAGAAGFKYARLSSIHAEPVSRGDMVCGQSVPALPYYASSALQVAWIFDKGIPAFVYVAQPMAVAELIGPTTAQMPFVPALIDYSTEALESIDKFSHTVHDSAQFAMREDTRFVSARGSIAAYIRPDALLMNIANGGPGTVLAVLRRAGVSDKDIVDDSPLGIWVRVRPVNDTRYARLLALTRPLSDSYLVPFVRDCGAAERGVLGLALNEAFDRSRVMASVASGTVGRLLGVIDDGGTILDAVCGFGASATSAQLVEAAKTSTTDYIDNRMFRGAFATVRRSISAAWSLQIPSIAHPAPSESATPFAGALPTDPVLSRFVTVGPVVMGYSGFLKNLVEPVQAYVTAPDWMLPLLSQNDKTDDVSFVEGGDAAHQTGVHITATNFAALQRRVDLIRRFMRDIAEQRGAVQVAPDVLYNTPDCRYADRMALVDATRDALRQLKGRPIRFLKQAQSGLGGKLRCLYIPTVAAADASSPFPGFQTENATDTIIYELVFAGY